MLDLIPAAPAGDSAVPAETPQLARYQPQFSGRAGEYFGIWFVNLLLGIVTLGIYSAWGKVRTQRYFYGNTRLAGASFDYLASPIAILKGRLLAYAVVVALVVSARFSPGVYALLLVAVGLLMPALVTWSLRFRARNSAWRGLSFRFDESAATAYGPFMLWAWLAGISMSLLYPVMKMRQHEFIVEGHRYGTTRFSYRGNTGAYYLPYGIAVILGIAAIFGLGVAIGMLLPQGGEDKAAAARLAMMAVAVFYVIGFGVLALLRIWYTNLLWNSARLGPHRFESTLGVFAMLWIYLSNGVAIVCTIGMAVPWAMVRLARYRAAHFTLVARGDLDAFAAASDMRAGAGGSELVDALDVGMDFGF